MDVMNDEWTSANEPTSGDIDNSDDDNDELDSGLIFEIGNAGDLVSGRNIIEVVTRVRKAVVIFKRVFLKIKYVKKYGSMLDYKTL